MRLYYEPAGQNKIYIYPIGIGKEDWATPVGTLKIIEKTVDPKWVVPESIYKYRKSIGDEIPRVTMPGPDNPLGKYRLRLSKPTYLIHGTNEPESVGRRSSGGCIHLYNEDIDVLYHMVTVGTRVRIIDNPYKATVSDGKLYLEAHMPLLEDRLKFGDDVSLALRLLQGNNKDNVHNVDIQQATQITKQHLGIPLTVENLS
jgi:L,D-transpeptidase ErfK/SrfK